MPILKNYFSEIKGVDPRFNYEGEKVGYEKYSWIVKPEYDGVVDPEEEMRLILQLARIQRYALTIKKDIDSILPYVTIITSLIYLVGGIIRFILLI